ncbi:hypothetical protein [Parasitella parasitica]|uniref:Homeobox domain-containing protein n=1 Tax=Parasitella parasitica TaxID=35722 RepID=A0A0B7NL18_9FUNG|nr:hypothetical protein [Parasitella parasitica]
MQFMQSSTELNQQKNNTAPFTTNHRRNSLAISALLNDVSVDPMQHPLAPSLSGNLPWSNNDMEFKLPPYQTYYSPISSGASSPNSSLDSFSRQSSITEAPLAPPPDLWSHSRTGMHQTNNGIIVSSLAKAKRKRILPHQYKRLMSTFDITDTPSSEIRSRLAEELDMTKREVQVWFQNRRAKMNRNRANSLSVASQQEQQQQQLPPRHHSLTLSSSSSLIDDAPRRRASEYSHPYSKHMAPRNSLSIEHNYNFNTHSTNNANQHHRTSTMVLQAPYRPPPSPTFKSAIDILASAAEMMKS